MNRFARAGVVAAATASIGLTASPALAGGGSGSEDDDGGFVPVEEVIPTYYDAIETQACGTTVTIATGDVRDVEVRETVLPDGTVVVEYRGGLTLDLTREGGGMIDELDASGAVREVIAADGGSAEVTLDGPSLIFPFPGEEELFADAGLPGLSYFKRGEVTLNISADFDPTTGVPTTTSVTADVDARIIDLCRRFDNDRHRGDKHVHDDRRGDKDDRHRGGDGARDDKYGDRHGRQR